MKKIIKLAIENGYESDLLGCFCNSVGDVLEFNFIHSASEVALLLTDKSFWKSIDRGGTIEDNKLGFIPRWKSDAITFYQIVLDKSLEEAINWLETNY